MKKLIIAAFLLLMCTKEVDANELNAYRIKNGRKPWTYSQSLQNSAYNSAKAIHEGKREWSHKGYVGYITSYYGKAAVVSENLADNFDSSSGAIAAWKVSKMHNAVLLQKNTCEYGFASYGDVYVLHTGCKK